METFKSGREIEKGFSTKTRVWLLRSTVDRVKTEGETLDRTINRILDENETLRKDYKWIEDAMKERIRSEFTNPKKLKCVCRPCISGNHDGCVTLEQCTH